MYCLSTHPRRLPAPDSRRPSAWHNDRLVFSLSHSLITVRRLRLQFVSLLGTLAILLTTFAPVISHLLAATNAAPAGMAAMHCNMPSMRGATMASHGDNQANPHADQHASPGNMQDCGYCNLLAHLPVVPGVPIALPLATRLVHARIAARFDSQRRIEPLTFALARAPPLA